MAVAVVAWLSTPGLPQWEECDDVGCSLLSNPLVVNPLARYQPFTPLLHLHLSVAYRWYLNLLYMLHFTCVKYNFFTFSATPKHTSFQLQISISSTDSKWAVYGICSANWDPSPAIPCLHHCPTPYVSASQVLRCPTSTVFVYIVIVIRIINISCCLK